MREKLIKLNNALVLGGASVTELTMREPTIGLEEDALSMAVSLGRESNSLTTEICMLALLTSTPYDALRQMTSYDYAKLRRAYDALTRPTIQDKSEAAPSDGTPGSSDEASEMAS